MTQVLGSRVAGHWVTVVAVRCTQEARSRWGLGWFSVLFRVFFAVFKLMGGSV